MGLEAPDQLPQRLLHIATRPGRQLHAPPVDVDADTNIFARTSKDDRQFLVYSTEFAANQDLAVTLAESEPEPDGAIVRGDEQTFTSRHPKPDIGLVVEVADSSRHHDRREKGRMYARAGLPV